MVAQLQSPTHLMVDYDGLGPDIGKSLLEFIVRPTGHDNLESPTAIYLVSMATLVLMFILSP